MCIRDRDRHACPWLAAVAPLRLLALHVAEVNGHPRADATLVNAQDLGLHSTIFVSAYFWSVVYECAYYGKFHASRVGKMSAGNGQQAAKEGTFHVVAVWFHCLHVSEMHDAARKGLTVKADFFDNSYEMRPSPETFVEIIPT